MLMGMIGGARLGFGFLSKVFAYDRKIGALLVSALAVRLAARKELARAESMAEMRTMAARDK
jgi:hypothetical protein